LQVVRISLCSLSSKKWRSRRISRHENHANQPSLSEYGKLRKGNKADFLKCIEDHGDTKLECLTVTAKIIDGAALVQMLLPGSEKHLVNMLKPSQNSLPKIRKVKI
jgi:hypothetical protein